MPFHFSSPNLKLLLAIIDYGMGNLHSVYKAFRRLGCQVQITDDAKEIAKAERMVLPGVGHFAKGMENLRHKGLDECIVQKAKSGIPLLGICLGMQLLTKYSDEGKLAGLGLIDANTLAITAQPDFSGLKVPHMGWNSVEDCKGKLFEGLNGEMFYFVHSYAVFCNSSDAALSHTWYGIRFHSAIGHNTIYGVQFHPEKSHKQGLQLLNNFIHL